MNITDMNRVIAEYQGYEMVTVNYCDDPDETEWQRQNELWMEQVGMESVGDYYVKVHENKWMEVDDAMYHEDWRLLMPVYHTIREQAFAFRDNPEACKLFEKIQEQVLFGSIADAHRVVAEWCKWVKA